MKNLSEMSFEAKLNKLRQQQEELLSRRNSSEYVNGVYERWTNPIITSAHAPLEWRYDLNERTNPYLMERIGIHATFNSGAIKWGDKYVLVVRVEADDDGQVFIYYASSDTRMHVATSTVDRLVDYCLNTAPDGFRTSLTVERICSLIDKNQ